MAHLRASSSTMAPLCVGSMCWMTTYPMPLLLGTAPKNCSSASSPPAEAPMPTMGNERDASPSRSWAALGPGIEARASLASAGRGVRALVALAFGWARGVSRRGLPFVPCARASAARVRDLGLDGRLELCFFISTPSGDLGTNIVQILNRLKQWGR